MVNIGELIDQMYAIDSDVHELESKIKLLKRTRSVKEAKLMRGLEKQKINKAGGKRALAALSSRRHPSIKDMRAFNKYVKAHNAFDLYQRRMNSKAYFDRLAEGEAVPGVEVFERYFIKITPKRT